MTEHRYSLDNNKTITICWLYTAEC